MKSSTNLSETSAEVKFLHVDQLDQIFESRNDSTSSGVGGGGTCLTLFPTPLPALNFYGQVSWYHNTYLIQAHHR